MTTGAETAIIIAAFNAEGELARAVTSALAQPEAAEVAIVDDGSSDATLAIARQLAGTDSRVKVLALPENRGPSAARNAAIRATTSPWIGVLDADDYLLPGRLARLHRHSASADFVADALIRTCTPAEPVVPATHFAPAAMDLKTFVRGNLTAAHGSLELGFLKPIMRRSFLTQHGLSYREDMRLGEDYLLYAEALAFGARFLAGGAAGYVSVERDGSLSKDHGEADLQRLRDCDAHLHSVRPLSAAEARALSRRWRSVDCRLQWRRLISAVKTRDVKAALGTFHAPHATLYLGARLGEEAWRRSIGRWLAVG